MSKRIFDLFLSLLAAPILAPLMILVAAVIKATSNGPVLHHDTRVGLGGRRFTMYKFRSMARDSAAQRSALMRTHRDDSKALSLTHDPRVTRFGRFIRRTSIDELPQLYNVLKGDMSLVGPRPLLEGDFDHVSGISPAWKKRRFEVRPGLTGAWQVRARVRNIATMQTMIADDIAYVERWSLGRDLKIIAATPFAVLRGKGTT